MLPTQSHKPPSFSGFLKSRVSINPQESDRNKIKHYKKENGQWDTQSDRTSSWLAYFYWFELKNATVLDSDPKDNKYISVE